MTRLIIAIALTTLLAGCSSNVIIRKEPYPVYVTIPMVQRAPDVGRCDLQVDKMTDATDHGTIAQAYKHDTECLRSKIAQYELILQQYNATADVADKAAQELKDQFSKVIEQYKQEISAIEASRKP